jgi:hypothetical protein
MDYSEWLSALFEETYPKALLSHGEIFYGKQQPEQINVRWGSHRFTLDLADFYSGEATSPLVEMKQWIYSHMPYISEENDHALAVFNTASRSYDALVLRPMGNLFPLRNVVPEGFVNFGNTDIARKHLNFEMDGTVLCIHPKEKKLPASFAVSHKEVFTALVNDYIDYDDNLFILLPDSINTNHLFVGHADSIQRLAENFDEACTEIITAGEWFDKLDLLQHEGNNG